MIVEDEEEKGEKEYTYNGWKIELAMYVANSCKLKISV
jgi:hypothetical protein